MDISINELCYQWINFVQIMAILGHIYWCRFFSTKMCGTISKVTSYEICDLVLVRECCYTSTEFWAWKRPWHRLDPNSTIECNHESISYSQYHLNHAFVIVYDVFAILTWHLKHWLITTWQRISWYVITYPCNIYIQWCQTQILTYDSILKPQDIFSYCLFLRSHLEKSNGNTI